MTQKNPICEKSLTRTPARAALPKAAAGRRQWQKQAFPHIIQAALLRRAKRERGGKCMEKIERMHWLYGLDPGRRCRECSRLEWMRTGGQTVCKCAIYGVNPGEATDWSADWEACGLRNRSYAGVKIQTLEDAGPKTP